MGFFYGVGWKQLKGSPPDYHRLGYVHGQRGGHMDEFCTVTLENINYS